MHAQDFMELHANKVPLAAALLLLHVASRERDREGKRVREGGQSAKQAGGGAALVLCNNNEKILKTKYYFRAASEKLS